MLNDEELRLKGVLRMDGWTDICDCRVAFATEKKEGKSAGVGRRV